MKDKLIDSLAEEQKEQEAMACIASKMDMGVVGRLKEYFNKITSTDVYSKLFTLEQLIDIVRDSGLPDISEDIKQDIENKDEIDSSEFVNHLNIYFLCYEPKDGSWGHDIEIVVMGNKKIRYRMQMHYGLGW